MLVHAGGLYIFFPLAVSCESLFPDFPMWLNIRRHMFEPELNVHTDVTFKTQPTHASTSPGPLMCTSSGPHNLGPPECFCLGKGVSVPVLESSTVCTPLCACRRQRWPRTSERVYCLTSLLPPCLPRNRVWFSHFFNITSLQSTWFTRKERTSFGTSLDQHLPQHQNFWCPYRRFSWFMPTPGNPVEWGNDRCLSIRNVFVWGIKSFSLCPVFVVLCLEATFLSLLCAGGGTLCPSG